MGACCGNCAVGKPCCSNNQKKGTHPMQSTRIFQPYRTVSGNDERGQRTAQPPRLSPGARVNDPADSVPAECYNSRVTAKLSPSGTAAANSRIYAQLGGWLAYPASTNLKVTATAANTANLLITGGTEFDSAAAEAGFSTIISGLVRDQTVIYPKIRAVGKAATAAVKQAIAESIQIDIVEKTPTESAQSQSLFRKVKTLLFDASRCAYNNESIDLTPAMDGEPLVLSKNQHAIISFITVGGAGSGEELWVEFDQFCKSQDLDLVITQPVDGGRCDGPPCKSC